MTVQGLFCGSGSRWLLYRRSAQSESTGNGSASENGSIPDSIRNSTSDATTMRHPCSPKGSIRDPGAMTCKEFSETGQDEQSFARKSYNLDNAYFSASLIMPLQDHFHSPLSVRRHWHTFQNSWATYLSSQLNRHLPTGFFAEANVQFGIEIDVATFKESEAEPVPIENWAVPEPNQSVPVAMLGNLVEIGIFRQEGGPSLAGAIELVSPANKDRSAHREAFVNKCSTYLQQGVGLVIVDVVTDRTANLHQELLSRLHGGENQSNDAIYASAYRAIERNGEPHLDIWYQTLMLGQSLPTLPLWLHGRICLPVELQETYERTCREQRLIVA